ncbi:UNVERIFIED_CONTAM: hypothetical protein GTU68_001426 [Idotea baltica]|nr:hypothetical protein [Idotea baltica]
MEDFIEIYKSEQCLWKVQCKDYHNRDKRIKKINNLRTLYRKELKKVQTSKKSGAGLIDVYAPNLWYFENLDFLNDQEISRESLTNIEENESDVSII